MGSCEFSPPCKRWGLLHEGVGSFILSIYTSLLFSNFTCLNICLCNFAKPSWIVWFYWWRTFMTHFLLGGPSSSRFYLKNSYKKVSISLRRTCSTIGWTCPPWLCPKQERHFGALRRCTLLCSRPSLRCTPKLVHLLHTTTSTNLQFSFSFPKFHVYCWFPFRILTSICVARNNIKACRTLHHHILVLESNIDLLVEVLEPLVEVPTLSNDVLLLTLMTLIPHSPSTP